MMWGYGLDGFGWFVMVMWWVLVVAWIVWLVRSAARQPDGRGSARRLLDERFAAGELSVEEYQQRRCTLG
jgi:putative membrane protein